MALVRLTPNDLRNAVGEPRYWQQGNPARSAFSAWVTRGFQAMYGGDAPAEGRGMVFVRAYTRTRDGHTEHVGAHTRHAPQHQGDEAEPEGDQTGPTHLAAAKELGRMASP